VTAGAKPVVYVIAGPAVRNMKAWPKVRCALKYRVKGAKLAVFEDVFPDRADYQDTWQERLAPLSGAVVIPARRGGSPWVGEVAVREAGYLAGLKKPVFLFGTAGLVSWPSVKLDRPDSHPPALACRVITDEYRGAS